MAVGKDVFPRPHAALWQVVVPNSSGAAMQETSRKRRYQRRTARLCTAYYMSARRQVCMELYDVSYYQPRRDASYYQPRRDASYYQPRRDGGSLLLSNRDASYYQPRRGGGSLLLSNCTTLWLRHTAVLPNLPPREDCGLAIPLPPMPPPRLPLREGGRAGRLNVMTSSTLSL